MNLPKKIAAFTLTEMLLVVAISAIVAGLAFSIVTLFTRNIQLIQNNYNEKVNIQLFEEQLTLDFNRFHNVTYDPALQTLQCKTPIDSIQYTFNDSYLLRSLDTILYTNHTKELYFAGNKVEKGSVDAIKINLHINKDTLTLFVYKHNDAYQHLSDGN